MKKILLSSCLSLCMLNIYAAPKQPVTCMPEYEGKAFYMAYIESGLGEYGPAECVYQNKGDKRFMRYNFPAKEEYMEGSGPWASVMPGDKFCSVERGGTATTCEFILHDIIQGKRDD